MNKQIKQLAEQAGWNIDKLSAVNAENQNRKLQEFAKLIVDECLESIANSADDPSKWSSELRLAHMKVYCLGQDWT